MIKKYNIQYIESLNENIELLIDAFTIYYGEEFREYIFNKIDKIIFIWIKHKFLEEFYNKYSGDNFFKDIKYFLKYDNNEVIGYSQDIYKYKNVIKELLDLNSSNIASSITFSSNNNYLEAVIFPMFIINDVILIHELNHAISSIKLGIIEDDEHELLLQKNGFDILSDHYKIFEEIINERSSIDITDIFHDIGGNVFEKNYKLNINNDYKILLPLIEKFYNEYIDIIKYVKISDNLNMLYKYIDKEKFDNYVKFIDDKYKESINVRKSGKKYILYKEDIMYAESLVNEMKILDIKQLKLVKD